MNELFENSEDFIFIDKKRNSDNKPYYKLMITKNKKRLSMYVATNVKPVSGFWKFGIKRNSNNIILQNFDEGYSFAQIKSNGKLRNYWRLTDVNVTDIADFLPIINSSRVLFGLYDEKNKRYVFEF